MAIDLRRSCSGWRYGGVGAHDRRLGRRLLASVAWTLRCPLVVFVLVAEPQPEVGKFTTGLLGISVAERVPAGPARVVDVLDPFVEEHRQNPHHVR